MATRRPIKYQLVPITISGAGVTGSNEVDTDKLYERVTGIGVTATDDKGLSGATFKKFTIDRQEIYPEGHELRMINTGNDLSPNDKYDDDIDDQAQASKVSVSVTDGSIAGTAYPYTVTVYLRLENKVERQYQRKGLFQKVQAEILSNIKET